MGIVSGPCVSTEYQRECTDSTTKSSTDPRYRRRCPRCSRASGSRARVGPVAVLARGQPSRGHSRNTQATRRWRVIRRHGPGDQQGRQRLDSKAVHLSPKRCRHHHGDRGERGPEMTSPLRQRGLFDVVEDLGPVQEPAAGGARASDKSHCASAPRLAPRPAQDPCSRSQATPVGNALATVCPVCDGPVQRAANGKLWRCVACEIEFPPPARTRGEKQPS